MLVVVSCACFLTGNNCRLELKEELFSFQNTKDRCTVQCLLFVSRALTFLCLGSLNFVCFEFWWQYEKGFMGISGIE